MESNESVMYAALFDINLYTEHESKIGNLTRRRPEFEPGFAGVERAQPMALARETGSKSVASRRSQKPIFDSCSV